MTPELDKIFDQASHMLRQGYSKAEVLSKWPELKNELSPLLDTAILFSKLPKKSVPQPAMQRKYIAMPAKRLWLGWLHVSRFAVVSMSALLLAAVGISSGYAAYHSQPGDTLFSLKKAAEHAQIQLASNPQEKLNLQVAIAQQRLTDAQDAVNNSNDPQKQAAALSELAAETQNTANVLSQTAQNQSTAAVAGNDHPLIASLDAITTQQQALLQNLSDNKQTPVNQNILDTAQANVTKVASLKQQLEIASKDQALAALNSNPNAVTATGTITQLTFSVVSVNNKAFTLNGATIVKDDKGQVIDATDLKLKQPVEILGDQTATGLVARQISILKPDSDSGQVKGASTDSPDSSSTEPALQPEPTSTPSSSSDLNAEPDSNTAVGSFIIEDPAPQTDFKN